MDGQSDTIGQSTLPTCTTLLALEFGELKILNDLIRLRVADAIQHPILAYPQSEDSPVSYRSYTGQDLDAMINQTIARLDSDGVSDLDIVVIFLALSRLGYTVIMISPRLSSSASVALLETVGYETIIYRRTPAIRAIVGDILRQKLLKCSPIRSCSASNIAKIYPVALPRQHNPKDIALILHSSGSTGSPKPIFLSHQVPDSPRSVLYLSAIFMACPPLCRLYTYLLVDHPGGISVLKACKLVAYGGAPCPNSLGDRLVLEGVYLGGPRRAYERLYEYVYLAGYPALTTSNSDKPYRSFHSQDKYIARLDDRITLVNSEKKAILTSIPRSAKRSSWGLRAKEAPNAPRLPDAEFLETIWPYIAEANARAEAFS
ncbi:uncharacterized protein N7498_004694 [Penicillium cinerascens]|uniref:AMP-dependent synthetase/ligase domain-containing protein n=1 Tax=Penicillium cinerascens TaxID=70096 RepID=A0A9W9MMB3_9EURO|nr:uncharacterized protein N7498_004694 [Penicillium cinerascens]KAJ5203815.1 hypothetical protein N7498_004694 [Penicillium cinerascens]